MKKVVVSLLLSVMGALHVQADTAYPFLTFELTDGSKASVSVSSDVTLSFSGTTLTVGAESFTLTNLSKLYFSTSDETTTAISSLEIDGNDEIEAIYDLQGHMVTKDQMRRGIYIVKSKKGTSKLRVR